MVMRGALIGAEQRHIRSERVSDVVKLEKQRSCNGGRNWKYWYEDSIGK